MDSGGNMRSNEEKGAEKHMDDYLKSIGLQRKKIAKDGSCLFRAVAEQVLHCQSLHSQVRSKCVDFLRENRKSYEAFIEGDFEEYLQKLRDPQQWVGEVEINALAIMYKRDFWIFQEPGKAAVNITANNFKDKVQLCFLNGNHYDSVYPLSHVRNSAMCQSILYELLYEKVFCVDQNQFGVCQRPSKCSDQLIDDTMNPCLTSEESDTETDGLRQENGTCAAVVKSKGRGRGRVLSERVKRSLNPTLLRNVQYDVWHRSKKAQQKMDFCIASGMQFNVGDRCQVQVDAIGPVVSAIVKKTSSDNSVPVTVYNDELGEIRVPVWKLRQPTETAWSTVVREKRVSNGAGDWEHRGRGRGKPSSVHSSVSQTTAPPAGRGSKLHSWPQAPAVEEREVPNSKSEPVLFGLTKEQRLAKEEEERNAALVELQFPDDRSFPALGTLSGGQSEVGKKKASDKRRSQKNTTRKSPVEEGQCVSPCDGNRPKSSTPPLRSLSSPAPVAVSVAAPVATLVAAPASVAAAHKPNPHSCSAAAASAPAAKTSQSGMVPSSASHFSFVTPILPAASNSSTSSVIPALVPKAASSSPPTFIAPIAPSPTVAQSLIGRTTPSPTSVITHNPPLLTEALVQASEAKNNLQMPSHCEVSEVAGTNQLPKNLLQNQNQIQDQIHNQIQDQRTFQAPAPVQVQPAIFPNNQNISQTEPLPSLPPQTNLPFPPTSLQTSYPPPCPQNEPSVPAALSNQDPLPPPASQPQTEHPIPASSPDQALAPQHRFLPHAAHSIPLQQQLAQFYQDPLYPGFPQGDKGQVVPPPPISMSKSGADLPQDTNILRFFFNLGIKAYTLPMHAPIIYLLPLQQAHTLQPRALSRSPSPICHLQEPYHAYNPTPPAPQASYHREQSTPSPQSTYDRNPAHPESPHSSFNPAAFDHSIRQPTNPPQDHPPLPKHHPPQDHSHLPQQSQDHPHPPQDHSHLPQHQQSQDHPHPPQDHCHLHQPALDHLPQDHRHPPQNHRHPAQEHPHPPEPQYHRTYAPAQHVQWHPAHTNQAYMVNYQTYNPGYFQNQHHQQQHPNQGPREQPANEDSMLGLRLARLPGALEGSASANVPSRGNMNGGHVAMQSGVTGFGHSNQEVGENSMLLLDPPLDKPIVVTVTSSSGPGSPALYSPASHSSDANAPFYHKPSNHSAPPFLPANHSAADYIPANHSAADYIPANHSAVSFLQAESMSVSVGTEDWEEPRAQHRGPRRGYRGRGRGPYRARGYSNNYQYSQRGGRGGGRY